MEIRFNDKKLQKHLEDHRELKKVHGKLQSELIVQRINELLSAENLYDISKLPQARLHLLTGDRRGHFAVDVRHPRRMILLPRNGEIKDIRSITSIEIIEIVDYH